MAARDERRAVLVLAVLAAAGGIVRIAGAPSSAPGSAVLAPQLSSGDLARQAALSRRAAALTRPLLPGERVDVDRASAEELERLPRVGRKLADRIVAERESGGPFGSAEGLRRVTGIGPAMLAALARATTFSGVARIGAGPPGPAPRSPASPASGRPACPDAPISLNSAGAAELDCLNGIGPALAERIVADRAARGAFRSIEDLDRVPGIGKALVARLRTRLRVP